MTSWETELAVISGCLCDNAAIFEVAARVKPEDFEFAPIGRLWRHMLAVHADRKPVDPATIIPRIGGGIDPDAVQAFGEAGQGAYTAANVTHYADMVREASIRRRVVKLGSELSELAKTTQASELIATAMQRLSAMELPGRSKAVRFSDAYMDTLSAIDELVARRKAGKLAGAPTGVPAFDDALGGIYGPKLIILAARPAVGKTAVLNLAAMNMARHGYPGLVCSLEMSTDALVIRALSAEAGCNVTALANGHDQAVDNGSEAMMRIGDIPLFFDCDTYDIAGICAQASMFRHRHGIQWLAVDHMGLVETPKFSSRNDQLGHVSRTLKQLAKRLNIPVIALSQLSRECERDKRRPMLADLRDSGNLEQDADAVVFLHSPYENKHNPTRALEFGVLKNRGGRTGWIEGYEFDGATQRVVKRGGVPA